MSQNFDLGQQYFATQISTFHKMKIGGESTFATAKTLGSGIFLFYRGLLVHLLIDQKAQSLWLTAT